MESFAPGRIGYFGVFGTVQPHEEDSISVKYDTNRLGSINKTVTIMSNASNSPTIMKIKGNILEQPTEGTEVNQLEVKQPEVQQPAVKQPEVKQVEKGKQTEKEKLEMEKKQAEKEKLEKEKQSEKEKQAEKEKLEKEKQVEKRKR
jgi:outer membrane biosynthesis protein TonB